MNVLLHLGKTPLSRTGIEFGYTEGIRLTLIVNSNTTVPFELSQTKDFQRAL